MSNKLFQFFCYILLNNLITSWYFKMFSWNTLSNTDTQNKDVNSLTSFMRTKNGFALVTHESNLLISIDFSCYSVLDDFCHFFQLLGSLFSADPGWKKVKIYLVRKVVFVLFSSKTQRTVAVWLSIKNYYNI